MHSIPAILWFFLPAVMANMAPVLAARYNLTPSLNRPVDGGINWKGQPLFGEHKTVRGFFWGVIAGALTGAVQYAIDQWHIPSDVIVNSFSGAVAIGALLGFGALFGDAMKSFIKRRWAVRPGGAWMPYDQIDFVLGAALVSSWLNIITLIDVVIACFIIGLGSYLVSRVAVSLHIKSEI